MGRPRKQTYTMDMYLKKIKDGDISNDADVQRHFVWTNEQVNELIVTVLTDEYIPPVILGEENDSQLHIADGGQRSSALKQFRYGNYKITSSIEDSVIQYKKKSKNGRGDIVWEDAVFDLKNKTYERLPEELKKRFDEYQIETVIHEHCDRHRISKYIKRYNNHTSMNANQKAFTYLDNFAGYVREILNSNFFVDHSNYSEQEKVKGVVERIIVETIMCSNYLENWKKQNKAACKFLNDNASREEFERLAEHLHRLERIINDEVKDIFNSKDSFLLLTLFDKFTKLGVEDIKFYEFIKEFKNHLRTSKRNSAGLLYDEIDRDKGTKDKVVITAKLDLLESMMFDFLKREDKILLKTEKRTDRKLAVYIAENLGMDIEEICEQMDFYSVSLKNLTDITIKDGSRLLESENYPSMLAMMVYSYKEDKDLEEWLTEYAKKHMNYFADQKKNFLFMKKDFEKYCTQKNRAGIK